MTKAQRLLLKTFLSEKDLDSRNESAKQIRLVLKARPKAAVRAGARPGEATACFLQRLATPISLTEKAFPPSL